MLQQLGVDHVGAPQSEHNVAPGDENGKIGTLWDQIRVLLTFTQIGMVLVIWATAHKLFQAKNWNQQS